MDNQNQHNGANNTKGKFTKEDGYKNLERVTYWLGNGDTKISFALAFVGVLIGVLFTSDKTTEYIQNAITTVMGLSLKDIKAFISVAVLLDLVILLIFTVRGVIFLLRGLRASFNIEKFQQENIVFNSKLFWASISSKKFNDFNKELNYLSEDELLKDINSQTYINSVICKKKFENYNLGINSIKWAVIFFIILRIIMYIKF